MFLSKAKPTDFSYGSPFWVLSEFGRPYDRVWDYSANTQWRFMEGNAYITEKDAVKSSAETGAYFILQYFSKKFEAGSQNWFVYYDYERGQVNYDFTTSIKHCDLYFSSKDEAIKAVEYLSLDYLLKYYLNIKSNLLNDKGLSIDDMYLDLRYLNEKIMGLYPDFL